MRRMGDSVSWEHEYFTMDDKLSKVVSETFVRLYEEGLIYRGKRLVSWDPILKSAVSDLEVESEEEDGSMWHIRYPIEGSDETLVVATTGPKPCWATPPSWSIRRRALQTLDRQAGQAAHHRPPGAVIADEHVDKEFGTGVVKGHPAHDTNDYQVGQRHNLPMITIFTLEAKVVSHDRDPRGLPGSGPLRGPQGPGGPTGSRRPAG